MERQKYLHCTQENLACTQKNNPTVNSQRVNLQELIHERWWLHPQISCLLAILSLGSLGIPALEFSVIIIFIGTVSPENIIILWTIIRKDGMAEAISQG